MTLKKGIIIAAVVVALLGLFLIVGLVMPNFSLFFTMTRQMHAGKKYMDSLTDTEIQSGSLEAKITWHTQTRMNIPSARVQFRVS